VPRDFRDLTLKDLLDELATAEPAPGSGAVSALVVAAAGAMLAGAARASRSSWPEAGGIAAQAALLRARALELAGEGSEAYARALAVLAETPGETSEERDTAIADALSEAAELPLEIARAGADAAVLAATLADRADPTTVGDVCAAALLAQGAARAAASLVGINLTTAPGDPRIERAKTLAEDAEIGARRTLGDRWHSLH
jgi:formiminotetrahydrofolate cyclodeaminase